MGIALIAILIATGFVFSTLHYPTKYKLNRSEGWIPYFTIATIGCFFFALTLPFMMWLDIQNYGRDLASYFNLRFNDIKQWEIAFKELKFIAWAAASFAISLTLGTIAYLIYKIPPIREWSSRKLGNRDPLEKLIVENIFINKNNINNADQKLHCICVTLKSRKVYVGFCDIVVLEHGKINGFSLTPMLSGYRNEDNHRINFTVNYQSHFKSYDEYEDDPEEVFRKYKVTIFSENIEHINLFDADVYKKFPSPKPSSEMKYIHNSYKFS